MERYSSYKDSGVEWLGAIPGHWEVRRICYVFDENACANTDCKETHQLQFNYGEIVPKKNQEVDSSVRAVIEKYTVVHPNDIIINGLNLNYDFISQRVAQVKENGVITSAYIAIRPKKDVLSDYYKYFLKGIDARKVLHGMGAGVRLTLSWKELKKEFLPIPPLSEQRAMSAYLDRATAQLDAAITREQQMIDLLNERKRIIIQQAVTKGLDPNAKLKPSGVEWIGDVPEGWEVKRLKAASLSLTKGNGITKDEVFIDGDIPCVRYGEIYSKYNNSFVECLSKTKEGQIKSPRYFEHGDILFAGTGELVAEIGKSIVYMGHEKCMAGGDIIVMKHANNPVFMNYALNAQYAQDQKSYSKAKLKVVHISASEIGNVMLAIPPYGEQQAIATFLDEISEKINKAIKRSNALISLLQERKQILISEVVTGKIKVS